MDLDDLLKSISDIVSQTDFERRVYNDGMERIGKVTEVNLTSKYSKLEGISNKFDVNDPITMHIMMGVCFLRSTRELSEYLQKKHNWPIEKARFVCQILINCSTRIEDNDRKNIVPVMLPVPEMDRKPEVKKGKLPQMFKKKKEKNED